MSPSFGLRAHSSSKCGLKSVIISYMLLNSKQIVLHYRAISNAKSLSAFNSLSKSIIFFLFTLSFLMQCSLANIITCDDNTPCTQQDIICNPNEDCTVNCISGSSCKEKVIHCPTNGNCDIKCESTQSCYSTYFNASQQNGNFSLHCEDPAGDIDEICRYSIIEGSKITPNIGTKFEVLCIKDRATCRDSEIHCAKDMDCFVQCGSTTDGDINNCRDSEIFGPIDHEVKVDCNQNQACRGLRLQGYSSSKTAVTCTDANACCDFDLYCPPNSGPVKNCIISGPALDIDKCTGSGSGPQFFAEYGWTDVDISGITGEFTSNNEGTMFCGSDYSQTCPIIADWICANSVCTLTTPPTSNPTFNPITPNPTNHPSINPTMQTSPPSANPVTSNPTAVTIPPSSNPSQSPATAMPTKTNATMSPSVNPTPNPTVMPSTNPTSNPTTGAPTLQPTNPPTSNPVTSAPTSHPSVNPTTASPITSSPSSNPTSNPTDGPTTAVPATDTPTKSPLDATSNPSLNPTTSNPTTSAPTTDSSTTASPTTSSPTTTAPTTSAPATANPTTKDPTSNPTIHPTSIPSSHPTLNPITASPTTAEPTTPDPTRQPLPMNQTYDPTVGPTFNPTSNPITAQPTTSEPTTFTPTTTSPTTLSPTTTEPTRNPLGPGETHNPSMQPTSNPTSNPVTSSPTTFNPTTSNPTTNAPTTTSPTTPQPSPLQTGETRAPTVDPTNNPTISCDEWEVDIKFTLLQYNTSYTKLHKLCTDTFTQTIRSSFNLTTMKPTWCFNMIHFKMTPDATSRRRSLLQTSSNLEVEATFEFNDALYTDYFFTKLESNTTKFSIDYISNLLSTIAVPINITGIDITEPIQIDPNLNIPSLEPTYAPHILQTRLQDHEREDIIIVLCLCFGICCCCILGYSCRLFLKHEMEIEDKYASVVKESTTPSIQNNSIDSSKPADIEMIITTKHIALPTQTPTGHTHVLSHSSVSNVSQITPSVNAADFGNRSPITPLPSKEPEEPEEGGNKVTTLVKPDLPTMDKQSSFGTHIQNKLVEEESLFNGIINEMQFGLEERDENSYSNGDDGKQ